MRKYLGLILSSLVLLSQPAFAANNRPTRADSIRQYRGQAMGMALNNDNDQALACYSQALSLAKQEFGATSPYVAEIYFDMGVVALESDKFEHAENLLKESIKLNPNSMVARLKLGELMNRRAQYDEAAKQARYVLSRQKDNIVGRYVLAEAYAQNDNSVKSMQEYFYMDALANGFGNVAPPVPAPGGTSPVAPPVPSPKVAPAKTDKKPAAKVQKPAEKKEEKKVEKPKAEKPKVEKPKVEKPKVEKPKKAEKKPVKEKAQPAAPTDILGGQAKLKTTPVLLTPVNKKPPLKLAEPKIDPTETTEEPDAQPKPAAVAKPPKPAAASAKPAKKSPRGFVPPPPPVMPSVIPIAPPPPMQSMPPPKKVEKPKVEKSEPKEEKQPEGGNEDPDFLLDWGGKKKK